MKKITLYVCLLCLPFFFACQGQNQGGNQEQTADKKEKSEKKEDAADQNTDNEDEDEEEEGLNLPLPSPKAEVEQRIGMTEAEIEFYRPGVKGRTIWGELVPYDKMWRTGANHSNVLSFSTDVKVEGKDLPAGSYSLFTIPSKSEWTVVLNKNTDLWGTGGYKEEEDALRVKVTPEDAPFRERMMFTFDNVTDNSAELVLHWEKLKVPVKIDINTDELAMKSINEALADAKEDDFRLYQSAASYVAESGKHLDKGLEWINKSLDIKKYWYSYWVKADILAAQEKYDEAVASAEKAIKEGKKKFKEEDRDFPYADRLQKKIKEWKEK